MKRDHVCPVALAPSLDNWIRRRLQDPRAILSPFIHDKMKVLDVGCGPGFFSVEMARLVGQSGTVISADLQQGMLEILARRIKGTELESRIKTVICSEDRINVTEQVDFILAFYMVHEIPDKASFFKQLHAILKNEGKLLLVEPKLLHVTRREFTSTLSVAKTSGFNVAEGPKLVFSWSAVLTNNPSIT